MEHGQATLLTEDEVKVIKETMKQADSRAVCGSLTGYVPCCHAPDLPTASAMGFKAATWPRFDAGDRCAATCFPILGQMKRSSA